MTLSCIELTESVSTHKGAKRVETVPAPVSLDTCRGFRV